MIQFIGINIVITEYVLLRPIYWSIQTIFIELHESYFANKHCEIYQDD